MVVLAPTGNVELYVEKRWKLQQTAEENGAFL